MNSNDKKETPVIIIAAMSKNKVIGKDGKLPWKRLPGDLPRFREYTVGGGNNAVIYGSKTLPFMGVLEGRRNIVLSRQEDFLPPEHVELSRDLNEAIDRCEAINDEIYIAGGGQVYTQALANPRVTKMILTITHQEYEGDIFFPMFDRYQWKTINSAAFNNEQNPELGYNVLVLERILPGR